MANRGKSKGGSPEVRVRIDTGERPHKPTRAEKARADLADVLDSLKLNTRPDAGYTIRLWRYNPSLRDNEYLGPVPLADFSLDYVAERYGGGQYGWRVADGDGKYQRLEGGQQRFNVAGDPKFPAGDSRAGAAGAVVGSNPDMRYMLDFLKELALRREERHGGGNAGDIAVQLATAMSTVQAATMQTVLTMVKGAGAAPAGGAGDLVENVTAVLDLADRIGARGGDGGGDPLLAGMFATVAKALERVAETQRFAGRTPIAREAVSLPAPAPAAAPVAPVAPAAPEASDVPISNTMLAPLAPYVRQLVKLAERNKDPDLYADVLLDQLGDHPLVIGYLDDVRTADARALLEAQIGETFPETQAHGEWFAQLWRAVWAGLDADRAESERPDSGDTPSQPSPERGSESAN